MSQDNPAEEQNQPQEQNPEQPEREPNTVRSAYRGATSDPLFGLLLAGAISIGLTPLINSGGSDMRLTLSWGILALFGVIAWLLGSIERIGEEKPENLAWGVAFGLILAVPILAFGGGLLSDATVLLFREMGAGGVLAYVVFIMPLGETLFFRGIIQQGRPFWTTGLIATAWGLVLFFPAINFGPLPLVIGVVLLMANLMYSYVRERNGLAAAWICQIIVSILLFFIPFATL